MILNLIENILVSAWNTLAEMSPYLLFGFFVAGLLSVFISQKLVERHLGGNGIMPVLKASAFGVPLPLCSCGVIPVSMSLHKHGASKGATVSFLLSTPQTGVDSIFVTLSLLGPVFAIFRPLAALITGLVGGILVNLVDHNKPIATTAKCEDKCCNNTKNSGKFIRIFKYGFVTLPRDIGKAMLIGLIVAAVISAVVPDGFFAEKLGTGFMAMVVMMLLGIPVYVCATASVPVAAAMILKGLTPGAALVFLMTGPATNAASFVTIWKTLGPRTAIAYIISVAGCAIAAGLTMDFIAGDFKIDIISHHGWMLPPTIKYTSAFLLLGILSFAVLTKKKSH